MNRVEQCETGGVVITDHLKKHIWLYLTIAICVVQICCNSIWIAQNDDFMGCDVFQHLVAQERLYHNARDIVDSSASIMDKVVAVVRAPFNSPLASTQYVGLVYLVTVLQKLCFGNYHALPFFANSVYLIILFLSTYAIGVLCANGAVACLAVFILSTFPQIAAIGRYYGLDYPLMAFVAASFLFLLKSNYYQNAFSVVLFTLCCIVGILIKGQFVFFIVPACILVFYFAITQKKVSFWRLFLLCLIPCAGVVLATSVWWKGNVAFLMRTFWAHATYSYLETSQELVVYSSPVDSSRSGMFYIAQLFFYVRMAAIAMFPFYFIVFLSSLWCVGRRYARLPVPLKVLFVSAVVAYSIFTVIAVQNTRYLFPSYFAYALFMAYCIMRMRSKMGRNILVGSIIVVGCLQVLVMSFGPMPIHRWITRTFANPIRRRHDSGKWLEPMRRSNIREHVRSLARHIDETGGTVVLLPQEQASSSRMVELEYYLIHERPDIVVVQAADMRDPDALAHADYLVLSQNTVFEKAVMGDSDEADSIADPVVRAVYNNRENYALVWFGELCAIYGEEVRTLILVKNTRPRPLLSGRK